jgi:hypothetical protein
LITGDTRKIEERIKRFAKLEDISLNMLCKPALVDNVANAKRYRPVILAFGLEPEVLDILPKILECSNGVLFMKLWEKRGNEMAKQKGRNLVMEEILTELWEPTYTFWCALWEKLKTGNLLFSEFEKFFKTADIDILREELIRLSRGGNTSWINKRLDQLQKYINLRSCSFSANAIMEVVKEYDLQGDFSQIIEIIELVSCKKHYQKTYLMGLGLG